MADLISFIKNEFDANWNIDNLEAVIERFAEDAVVQTVPPLPGTPDQFVGKAQVRGFLQMLMGGFHVDSKDFRQQGDRVTWFATVTSKSIRAMGVDALDANCEAVVQNGKCKLFVVTFTQETLSRLTMAANQA